jgi:CheY-like chemotaxis protein
MRNSSSPQLAGRILLVDDNLNGLKARRTVLQELGLSITVASSGAEALELFDGQDYDALITDYKMPKMDGIELIRRVREKSPAMRIILLSGYVEALGLSEQTTGADAVIQKSANEVAHLTRAVTRLLRRNSPRKPQGRESLRPKRKQL